MITINKAFQWSPNGYDIERIEAGSHDHLPDRAVAIADDLGVLVPESNTRRKPDGEVSTGKKKNKKKAAE
ncbi:hypothetical protein [Candidatus Sororendozoicomonas aggregata]|uniref:hypothetical protein n=1 Tax=Candidatus Sororendozoicomonas aggregata TaxID=3073239 RepID=UPI002ED1CA9E